MDTHPCSCQQGWHYLALLYAGDSMHLYLAWLCEHLGVQGAREDVRTRQLTTLTHNAHRRKRYAKEIRVLRRFIGEV